MSLAIRFGDNKDSSQLSGFLYFDVVTKYSKQLSGQVTSHPLDAGVNITDHYTAENPKYSIVGVISSADISGVPLNLLVDGEKPLNVNQQSNAVQIDDSYAGTLSGISGTLASFLRERTNTVRVDASQRTDYKSQVNSLIERLMTGILYDEKAKKLKNRMTLITLYGFDGNVLDTESDDLVMTSFSVDEDADSGTGMFISMTLEKVSFVTLQKAELPKDVSATLSKSAQGTSKKSKVDSTKKTVGNKDDATSGDPGPGNKMTTRERLEKSAAEAREKLNKKKVS